MKISRHILFVLTLAIATLSFVALAGCSSSISGGYTFDGGSVAVDGKTLTVTLDGNPTTGYEWTDAISGTNIEQTESSYTDQSSTGVVVGESHSSQFVYEGKSAGTSTITFTYARSWESTAQDQTVTVNVKTNADGKFSHIDTVIDGKTCGEANA